MRSWNVLGLRQRAGTMFLPALRRNALTILMETNISPLRRVTERGPLGGYTVAGMTLPRRGGRSPRTLVLPAERDPPPPLRGAKAPGIRIG